MVKDSWQVHKFGGSSLADPACFRRVGDILLDASPAPIAVVVSAMGGMTDALLGLVTQAEQGPDAIAPGLEALSARYEAAVAELIDEESVAAKVLDAFRADLSDASDVLHAISLVHAILFCWHLILCRCELVVSWVFSLLVVLGPFRYF